MTIWVAILVAVAWQPSALRRLKAGNARRPEVAKFEIPEGWANAGTRSKTTGAFDAEIGVVWWPECSKQTSRSGKRDGKQAGFPRFTKTGTRRRPRVVPDRGDARRTGSPAPHAAGHRHRPYPREHPPPRTPHPVRSCAGAGDHCAPQRAPVSTRACGCLSNALGNPALRFLIRGSAWTSGCGVWLRSPQLAGV